MTDNTEQPLTATDGRTAARKAFPVLAGLGAFIAAGLIVFFATRRDDVAGQTTEVGSAHTATPATAPAARPAHSGARVIHQDLAKVVGVDLSNARVVGLSSKDGKMTVQFSGAHLLWKKSTTNDAVATAEGGAR